AHRDWLVTELENLRRPVDPVGHDSGGAHVVNVATTRPDLLATWCCDTVGWFDTSYAWHTLARLWQTPTWVRPQRRHCPTRTQTVVLLISPLWV
ncbi:hypothetical protein V3592_45850, partial [Bradyrhizobium japonicum]